MFSLKPDFEQSLKRMDAFWERELLDRPIVQFLLYKPADEWIDYPNSGNLTLEDAWLDIDYRAAWNQVNVSNQLFLGDTMPVVCPNLGADVFAALYDCPLFFQDPETSWCEPIVKQASDFEDVKINWDSPWLAKLHQLTDAYLEIGKDKFITGMPDWSTGGDCLAAMRGPMDLAADLIKEPPRIKNMLIRIENDYKTLYQQFYNRLRSVGQPISTWIPLVSKDKYYPVSNDFSITISAAMFRDIFLEDVERKCRFLDRSIYHMDGPGALRHLDAILEIAELDAVQFIPTPGNDSFLFWAETYLRIQNAEKCVLVNCSLDEIEDVLRTLKPEGLYLYVKDIPDEDNARKLIHRLESWCLKY